MKTKVVKGTRHNDVLDDEGLNSKIIAHAGDDVIHMGLFAGTNDVDGGKGFDTLDYSNSLFAIDARLFNNPITLFDESGAVFSTDNISGKLSTAHHPLYINTYSIESIVGSDFDDRINIKDNIQTAFGGEGNDQMFYTNITPPTQGDIGLIGQPNVPGGAPDSGSQGTLNNFVDINNQILPGHTLTFEAGVFMVTFTDTTGIHEYEAVVGGGQARPNDLLMVGDVHMFGGPGNDILGGAHMGINTHMEFTGGTGADGFECNLQLTNITSGDLKLASSVIDTITDFDPLEGDVLRFDARMLPDGLFLDGGVVKFTNAIDPNSLSNDGEGHNLPVSIADIDAAAHFHIEGSVGDQTVTVTFAEDHPDGSLNVANGEMIYQQSLLQNYFSKTTIWQRNWGRAGNLWRSPQIMTVLLKNWRF